jgi:hypothetical protein
MKLPRIDYTPHNARRFALALVLLVQLHHVASLYAVLDPGHDAGTTPNFWHWGQAFGSELCIWLFTGIGKRMRIWVAMSFSITVNTLYLLMPYWVAQPWLQWVAIGIIGLSLPVYILYLSEDVAYFGVAAESAQRNALLPGLADTEDVAEPEPLAIPSPIGAVVPTVFSGEPIECKVCGRKCATSQALSQHMKYKHPEPV